MKNGTGPHGTEPFGGQATYGSSVLCQPPLGRYHENDDQKDNKVPQHGEPETTAQTTGMGSSYQRSGAESGGGHDGQRLQDEYGLFAAFWSHESFLTS